MLVTAITGGNPDLDADRRNVLKLGANWQPFEKTDLRLRGEYVHQTIARPISNFMVTSAIEAAFPHRFVRDDTGQLTAVDLRPANFQSSERNTLRIGFDFSKPLKSHQPSQAVLDQMRAQFGGRARGQNSGGSQQDNSSPPGAPPGGRCTCRRYPGWSPPENAPPPARRRRSRRRAVRRPRRWRLLGGGNRGRLTFSLTDTITFVDKVAVAPGLNLDYLHGDASGQMAARPGTRSRPRQDILTTVSARGLLATCAAARRSTR